MNSVVFFEMPYEDRDRVSQFYSSVFGWQTKYWGNEMEDYITVNTTETENGRPKEAGAINGGLFKKNKDNPAQVPNVIIAVDDLQDAIKRVKDAGGQILGDPVQIENVGWYVSFFDPEGNRVSLLQPSM